MVPEKKQHRMVPTNKIIQFSKTKKLQNIKCRKVLINVNNMRNTEISQGFKVGYRAYWRY